ncbi:MAG: uroporphyrinogen-III synthase [Rhizobiaceae bacterium]
MRLTDPEMHFLVTRPSQQAAKTVRLLNKIGHSAMVESLLDIELISTRLPAGKYAGLIITSSNGAAGLELNWPKDLNKKIPVLATGEATARAVRDAGFADVDHCSGAALDVVAQVPDWMSSKNLSGKDRLLYPCAQVHAHDIVGLLLDRAIQCDPWPVYRSIAKSVFSLDCQVALKNGEISTVLLYSKRTAHTFVELMRKHKLSMNDMHAYVLSRDIFETLPKELQVRTKYPDQPDETSLMKLLAS